ncbi:MAG: ketopantoate reductase family protein [Candidatus Omnitrophica bacterium]|jgi:2-dehydropantoate 2-reductase|nr:ketopantoate reductase family protein [Candidatus Omnitrophota bacterium]MDD5512805.1 ketopantoate reductase family protein [Candidatus Omnitrophota bacterium]
MKIAVIGPGAIGGLVAGYLKLNHEEVSLVGHADAVEAIQKKGLEISGVRGKFNLKIDVSGELDYSPELAIICTKTQDLAEFLQKNRDYLKDSLILCAQNGVRAEEIISGFLPEKNIISSIVMFGSTYLEPAKITHNFEGSWIIGRRSGRNDDPVIRVSRALEKAFSVILAEELLGMKYLKIFVNANNCLPAILGQSMQEVFAHGQISRISIAIWKEGLMVTAAAGIKLVSLPDFPLERMEKLLALPGEQAAGILSGIISGLSKEPLYGSILQSIKRGRPSEIDYINGEFIALAGKHNTRAPLNEKLVEMVHAVEQTGKFYSKEELVEATKSLIEKA